jgi:hypothetical protein
MKKLSVFIALALLAVAGTGYAVTCAYDNVPGATLLVPYWRVSLNGVQSAPIPSGGIDTLVSVVNVSTPGVIAHVTVWNKYSKAVLDFNIPLTGKDVVSFSMRDVMNGNLNVNLNTQFIRTTSPVHPDPCLNLVNPYGFGQTQFLRFANPDPGDNAASISVYAPDAFSAFRNRVWDSLDESGDITSFTSSSGANILDTDNPVCFGAANGDGVLKSDLSGYLTIDVVNFCTNYFPEDIRFFNHDAIATAGWGPTYTPNVLMGDIFYVDTASVGGNISGDPAIALEFDPTLTYANLARKTFYGKFVVGVGNTCVAEQITGCVYPGVPAAYQFPGDGREALGNHYGFRYLSDTTQGLRTWILVWRSDLYNDSSPVDGSATGTPTINLCDWLEYGAVVGSGLTDADHKILTTVYDNDENQTTVGGGPSGGSPPSDVYVFLESQRLDLYNNGQFNPNSYKGGWVDALFTNPGATSYNGGRNWNQAWVGVQHTAPGALLSVGLSATELDSTFNCVVPVVNGATSAPVK